MERAPHADRVAELVEALGTPVVQVWGWPGSGVGAVLDALLDRLGESARGVSPADLSETGRWTVLLSQALDGGARWLICPASLAGRTGADLLRERVRELPAGVRLVLGTSSRFEIPIVDGGLVTPRELALVPVEVGSLWREAAREELSPDRAAVLASATDGWFRPLLLAAAATRRGATLLSDPEPLAAESLVALAPVADFLRHEVLSELSGAERDALVWPRRAAEGVVARLRDTVGLLLDDEGELRPPKLVRALLAREGAGSRAVVQVPGDAPEPLPVADVRVRLRFLGRPEAWRRQPDGSWRRLHWPLKRAFRALAYLATSAERRAAREDLIEALWPEESAETIRRNFHPTLSHLRRGLRPASAAEREVAPLLLEDGVYRLNPGLGWWIDVEEVARWTEEAALHVAEGRDDAAIAAWEAAWRLFRGELLEGLYDPWLVDRREDLTRRHLALLRGLGSAYERRGSLGQATDAYRAALMEDPLQERIHAALMRLYARRGRRDLVRRQYERLSALLREELGVEPLPETTDEYHRLMMVRG